MIAPSLLTIPARPSPLAERVEAARQSWLRSARRKGDHVIGCDPCTRNQDCGEYAAVEAAEEIAYAGLEAAREGRA